MTDDESKSEGEQIPSEFIYIPTEERKNLYQSLLAYGDSIGWHSGGEFVVFTLADGSFRFSTSRWNDISIHVLEEGHLSDRLLVIVSVAYLEDQLRVLLRKFFTDDDITEELLDPNKNIIASLVPMASMAFSLGLLAKEWYETIKRMATLRNKFAHLPYARSLEELTKDDPKTTGIVDSLAHRYKQFQGNEDTSDFRRFYFKLFLMVYHLLQFAIDHLAALQTRQPVDSQQIVNIGYLDGFNKETLELLLREDQ